MGPMGKHLQGDYEANCEKEVQGGDDRETSTMTKQVQMLGSLQFSGTVLEEISQDLNVSTGTATRRHLN